MCCNQHDKHSNGAMVYKEHNVQREHHTHHANGGVKIYKQSTHVAPLWRGGSLIIHASGGTYTQCSSAQASMPTARTRPRTSIVVVCGYTVNGRVC